MLLINGNAPTVEFYNYFGNGYFGVAASPIPDGGTVNYAPSPFSTYGEAIAIFVVEGADLSGAENWSSFGEITTFDGGVLFVVNHNGTTTPTDSAYELTLEDSYSPGGGTRRIYSFVGELPSALTISDSGLGARAISLPPA